MYKKERETENRAGREVIPRLSGNDFSKCGFREAEKRERISIRRSRRSPKKPKEIDRKIKEAITKITDHVVSSMSDKRDRQDEDEETAALEELEEEGVYRDVQDEVAAAGNIHKAEFREYWRKVLKPDGYVQKIISEGYRLPFTGGITPDEYEEPNNKSALQEMDYVREAVRDMVKKRSVTKLNKKPHCVNPLTVSLREIVPGNIKKRLCLDLSRWVNKFIKKESTKLTGLEKSCEMLLPGDKQATYDLSAAYHHIKIHEDFKKFLCFKVPNEEGLDEFYQFEVMPFGLASATQCLARVTKPICAHLAAQGIRHSLYIDDGKINARADKIAAHLEYTLDVLKRAGFIIAEKKTDTPETANEKKEYLGFEIDSKDMIIRAPEQKFTGIRQVWEKIKQDRTCVSRKTVAKFIGKAISLQPAIGPAVQLLTRCAQMDLAMEVDRSGWKRKMALSEEALEGMNELVNSLQQMNGQGICNASTAVTLESVLGPSKVKHERMLYGPIVADNIIAGDASDRAACSYTVKGLERFFLQKTFTQEEMQFSSGHRELLTVMRTLQEKEEVFEKLPKHSRTVLWLTDSTNMVTFLTKGSTKRRIQTDIL